MSKPATKKQFTWRKLITAMNPGSRYSFEMMRTVIANSEPERADHPSVAEARAVIETAGLYIIHDFRGDGAYKLTEIGERFREKELAERDKELAG